MRSALALLEDHRLDLGWVEAGLAILELLDRLALEKRLGPSEHHHRLESVPLVALGPLVAVLGPLAVQLAGMLLRLLHLRHLPNPGSTADLPLDIERVGHMEAGRRCWT